ncbi:MAG TPA: roadblock/LC7 domain-containing protein [candidate division Zixibacteria bacterium]|jgi:predicted regulator of Ras-like GTPase activity (Roadblock/LC7/MglB family)|nr:roadblock/LC7 domain-containing protein [candidate division Zixibacteria bacterium]
MSDDSLIIYEEEINQIDTLISKMLKGAEAKCALLVDKDGHLITRQGFTHSLDTTALAALLAGSFASTKEIARLVGEPEFSVLFHQGKKDHIHMSLVGERSILVVIFDDRTTIGMVRLYAKETALELAKIFEKIQGQSNSSEQRDAGITGDFTAQAQNKLDDIFQD